MKGLIMAGGEGTRLRPLTCGMPKPMIDVMGRPVMEHIVLLMKDAGITDIAVTLMYLPHMITDYFGDGSRFGVNLHYFVEETPLGTAGSVKNAQEFLDEPFVIISGDCLTDISIQKAAQFHRARRSDATIVLTRVETPLEYGIVVTDEQGSIVRFLEKPNWSEVFSDTANTGIYILNPSVLDKIPPAQRYDFSKDLFPRLLSDGDALFGYDAPGYWCDIGDLGAYRQCHFDILDKKVRVQMDAPEENGVFLSPGAVVREGAAIHAPCYLGDGAVVQSGAVVHPYSVIGEGTQLYGESSVKHSVLGCNVVLGKSAHIRGCIVGQGAQIGAHSMVLENAVIGAKTTLGEMCEVKNNIKIWPEKHIDNERVVSDNLIWGDNFSRRLFFENGVSGEINISVTPEFATRLGAAFGAVGKNARLAVACEGGGALHMLKSAFVAGMLSAGAQAFDLGHCELPVARRAAAFYGMGGGLHLSSLNTQGAPSLSVVFFDKRGGDISRDEERKIETLFMREDFSRSAAQDIAGVTTLYDYRLYYMREIINEMQDGINLPVCVQGSGPAAELLQALGAKLAASSGKGIITASFEKNAERLMLTDEQGKAIAGERYAALAALVAIRGGDKIVCAPISGSDSIDKIAARYGASVVRCKTSRSQMMECMLRHNPVQFRLMYDAVYAAAKILSYLSGQKIPLSELAAELPRIHLIEREVSCEAGRKGTVIRSIAETAKGNHEQLQLDEGVKIIKDKGWVLVIPHGDKPVCRVISEGQNEEFAAELCDFYTKEVEKYTK